MRHVDPNRRPGDCCAAACFLCAQACVLILGGRTAAADMILKPSGPEIRLPKFKPGQLGGIVSGFQRRMRKERQQHR